jgi:DNA-binding MarR family transcriptional regulator
MTEQHYFADTYHSQGNLAYLIIRAQSLMLGALEPLLEARGYSYLQYFILAWVRDGVAVHPKDVSAQYRHNAGAITRVLDRLAERGLLERLRGNRDRRKVDLKLTNDGHVAVARLNQLVVDSLNRILAELTDADAREIERLLLLFNSKLSSLRTD